MSLRSNISSRASGFILVCVLVPLLALLVLSASIAVLVGERWRQTQSDLDQGVMQENLDAVLWTLRYFYHLTAVSTTSPLDQQSANTIISDVLSTLNYTGGGAGDWATWNSPSNLRGLQLRITALSITNPGSPALLTNTGTFLDGRQVSQGAFTFTIEQQTNYSTSVRKQEETLVFCLVPSDALCLSGLGNWQNLSGNVSSFGVHGTAFVRGLMDGTTLVDFSSEQALLMGSVGGNVTRNGQSLAALSQASDERFQTEIAQQRTDLTQPSTDLRITSVQRASTLRASIPTSVMLGPGQAADPSLTAAQSQLYRLYQPFYSVNPGNRYWLSHDPNSGNVTAAVSPYGETNYSAGNLPPVGGWLVANQLKTVGGSQQVVLTINPALAPSPLFIGSIQNGVMGSYQNLVLEIQSTPSLSNDFTLITPNTIVVTGDLNSDAAHHLTLLGSQVYMGYSPMGFVSFNGTISSLTGSSPSPWQTVNGAAQTSAQINLQDQLNPVSPLFYEITLLKRVN